MTSESILFLCRFLQHNRLLYGSGVSHNTHLGRQCIETIVSCGGTFEETFFAYNDRASKCFLEAISLFPFPFQGYSISSQELYGTVRFKGSVRSETFLIEHFVQYLKPILRHGWLTIRCDLLRAFRGAVMGGQGGCGSSSSSHPQGPPHCSALHISKFIGPRSCGNKQCITAGWKSQVLASDPEGRSLQHADWTGRNRIRGIVEDGEQPPSCIRDCSDDLVAQQVVLQSARKHGAGGFDTVDLAYSAV
jgi:hypothetical protein